MGEQASSELVAWAVPYVLIGVFSMFMGLILYIANRKIDKLDNLSTRVDKLESSAVTADQVRTIFQEQHQPIMMAIIDMKDTVSELNASINKIQTEFAFKKGLEEGKLQAERKSEW